MTSQSQIRKIIHIDMDAFYASVEQLDHPELKNQPLAVGGSEKRGVVAAASYEARKFGVRSAMSGMQAKKLCPDLIFVKPRFDRYKEVSKKIRAIFNQYTDLVEPLSLDEAYLDVTLNKKGNPSATLIAQEIRAQIFNELNLKASAGISINKFVAKIASDFNKPNGQKTVAPEEVESFVASLDVRKFHGIGKVTAEKMYQMGIFTGVDLKNQSLATLEDHFGKSGVRFYELSRGIDHNPVIPDRIRKSLAAEHTFENNLASEIYMLEQLKGITTEVSKRLKNQNTAGKTITLKIKYSDFNIQTRSKTLDDYTLNYDVIYQTVKTLLLSNELNNSVRLLGISISNLNNTTTPKNDNVSSQLSFKF
ncbi:DNA polymerase IV [Paucihalobacter ruber]|uniref:DNA polymerase IV n=1 Tax=Paucihalobacter ruber TaxID=2567861 RepID=A0A506PNM4_9FLAO|nr:DNA polymerase IV [Paucihalobacter ruber]TPV34825.1 DNA polymerase IV [Paucihalobacter ruber]